MDFRLATEADEDLVAVFVQGCDLFGARQADRYVDELFGVFRRIATNPTLSRLRVEFDPPVHAVRHKAHVVIYDVDAQGVTILCVRHGREDWQSDPLGVETT